MLEILVAVGLFSVIVIGLALLILAARRVLVPSGDVVINVNGERDITTQPGVYLTKAAIKALAAPSFDRSGPKTRWGWIPNPADDG